MNFLDAKTRMDIYALTLAVLSLSYLPVVGPTLKTFLGWQIGPITLGVIVGAIGVYAAYSLYKRRI